MTMHRLPLFVWAVFITAILLILSLPVFAGKPKERVPALNLAICWKLYKLYTQSAGNWLILKGFRILRDYTLGFFPVLRIPYFSFHLAYHLFDSFGKPSLGTITQIEPNDSSEYEQLLDNENPLNISKWSKDYLDYITGLIEGDGTIIVPKKRYSDKGRKTYPSIEIAFHSHDLSLALAIQSKFGFGSLNKIKGLNAYRLTINSNAGILCMIEILNGRMKTPKIHSFARLIDWTNDELTNDQIPLKPLNTEPLNSTSWLSGLIEADGSFRVRATEPDLVNNTPLFHPNQKKISTDYARVECVFEFELAQTTFLGHSTKDCLLSLADLFKSSVKETKTGTKHPKYRVKTTSLAGNMEIEKYLEKFPLFGKKHLDFKDWSQVLQSFKEKQSNDKKLKIAKEMRGRMNDNRKEFTWNHLQNFY